MRLGASDHNILAAQGNLAIAYDKLGREEEALKMRRDVYSGRLRLFGEENKDTLISAKNYAVSLEKLQRFEEAKALMRKIIPVARRASGDERENTLRMRLNYGQALYKADGATLGDLREAVRLSLIHI